MDETKKTPEQLVVHVYLRIINEIITWEMEVTPSIYTFR